MINRQIRFKKPRNPMPGYVRQALADHNLMGRYLLRPPYQQNDYIGWISRAVRYETKAKRLHQMIRELREGNVYMNMAYNPRTSIKRAV